ncbi:hypothetical protein [Zunongwangia sp. H14]|uniref:hypothetical protein n=1 Tax=Zunongwangia sp. H14 TaxID=3240792 RepID=UPI0035666FF4
MKSSYLCVVAVIFSLFLNSCSKEDEVGDPEVLMPGVWKPIEKQYLDDAGKIIRSVTDDESECLRRSKWEFAYDLFQLEIYEETEEGHCYRNIHKQGGQWHKGEDSYYLFYSGGLMFVEAFEILHLRKNKMTLKLMGGISRNDHPVIISFEKISDEAEVFINY